MFFWVICGPEFYIQPGNVGQVTVLPKLNASWEFCIFIVFESVEISPERQLCFNYLCIVIQKLIYYLDDSVSFPFSP